MAKSPKPAPKGQVKLDSSKPPTEVTLKFWARLALAGEQVPPKAVVDLVEEVRRLRQEARPQLGRANFPLPDEFLILTSSHGVKPEVVLRGFVADLCGIMGYISNPHPLGYSSNGSDERAMAQAYYERCGYPYLRGGVL